MRILKKLFIVNTQKNRPWYNVVLWWEIRRILYNIILLFSSFIALSLLSLIIKDLTPFFSPPIFFFMAIAVFVLLANVFYSLGWVFQLIARNSSNRFIKKNIPRIFIYGLIFSFLIQLIPSFWATTDTLATVERIKSKYTGLNFFSTEKPKKKDLVGEYILSELSIKQLNFPDSLINKISYKLNPDMTFEFNYFPQHEFAMSLTEYEIVNTKGTWGIKKNQGSWVIPMGFDTFINIKPGEIPSKGRHYSNSFIINNEDPSYEIYKIIGDPDSWEGITLIKRK